MHNKELTKSLNLGERESAIYLASLELGMATAKEIAQKAGIQRTYFYDISENLLNIGLLKQSKHGKKRLFSPIEPEKILEIEKQKLDKLEKVLPELKALYNTKGNRPKIFYYEGREGIQKINDDTLRYKGEIIGFTTPRFVVLEGKQFSKDYIDKRVAVKNRVRVIGEVSNELIELKNRDENELRETRMLPKDLFSSEIEIGIYSNKVFVLDYKEEFGFIIESSEISKTFRFIFEIIWGSGKIIN